MHATHLRSVRPPPDDVGVPTSRCAVPAERLVPLMSRWLAANDESYEELARRSGIPPRTLYAIRSGSREKPELRVADAIVTTIDVLLWHTPPPDGLADLYDDRPE